MRRPCQARHIDAKRYSVSAADPGEGQRVTRGYHSQLTGSISLRTMSYHGEIHYFFNARTCKIEHEMFLEKMH